MPHDLTTPCVSGSQAFGEELRSKQEHNYEIFGKRPRNINYHHSAMLRADARGMNAYLYLVIGNNRVFVYQPRTNAYLVIIVSFYTSK